MLKILTPKQIKEWQIYASLEPFGENPAFWRAGMIAAIIANVNKGKGTRTFSPEDFMPKDLVATPQVEKKQTVEEQKKNLERIYSWAKKRGLTKKKELPEKKRTTKRK